MVFEILRHSLPSIQASLDFCMSDITCHNDCSVQRDTGRDRILREFLANLSDWLVEVNRDCITLACLTQSFWYQLVRFIIHFLYPDTILIDLCLDITVSRARNAKSDRARSAMTRKSYHTNIMSISLSSELSSKTYLTCFFQELLFKFKVTECTSCFITSSREVVVILCRSKLNSQKVLFCRCTTNNDCNMIRRTSSSAESLYFLNKEWNEGSWVLNTSLCLLIEVSFVGRATTLYNTEEFILHAVCSLDIYLCR